MAHTTVTFIGNHVVSDQRLLRETYRLRVTRVFDIKAATGLRKASIERTPEAVLGYGAIPKQRYSKEAWMQLQFPRPLSFIANESPRRRSCQVERLHQHSMHTSRPVSGVVLPL